VGAEDTGIERTSKRYAHVYRQNIIDKRTINILLRPHPFGLSLGVLLGKL